MQLIDYINERKEHFKLHGIQPTTGYCVRWLGAYGRSSDLDTMIGFESRPMRAVSAECFTKKDKSILTKSMIGLVIDTNKTILHRAYAGDAFTGRDSDSVYKSTRSSIDYVTSWGEAFGLVRKTRRDSGRYIEAVVDAPKYSHVVYRGKESDIVKYIGNGMKLPIIYYDDLFKT